MKKKICLILGLLILVYGTALAQVAKGQLLTQMAKPVSAGGTYYYSGDGTDNFTSTDTTNSGYPYGGQITLPGSGITGKNITEIAFKAEGDGIITFKTGLYNATSYIMGTVKTVTSSNSPSTPVWQPVSISPPQAVTNGQVVSVYFVPSSGSLLDAINTGYTMYNLEGESYSSLPTYNPESPGPNYNRCPGVRVKVQ